MEINRLKLVLPEDLTKQVSIIQRYQSVIEFNPDANIVFVSLRDYFESGLDGNLQAMLPDGDPLRFTKFDNETYLIRLKPDDYQGPAGIPKSSLLRYNKKTGVWSCSVYDYLYFRDIWGIICSYRSF